MFTVTRKRGEEPRPITIMENDRSRKMPTLLGSGGGERVLGIGKPTIAQVNPVTMKPIPLPPPKVDCNKANEIFATLAGRAVDGEKREREGEEEGKRADDEGDEAANAENRAINDMLSSIIDEMELKDVIQLQNSYVILNSEVDSIMTDAICMVNTKSFLWRFLDHLTTDSCMFELIKQTFNTGDDIDLGIMNVPIRNMARRRRKDGAVMTIGVPLELVQGAVGFLKHLFYGSIKKYDKGKQGTDLSILVQDRETLISKMSFAKFDDDMFAKYLNFVSLPEHMKLRMKKIYAEAPGPVGEVFAVFAEQSLCGQIYLNEKRTSSAVKRELEVEDTNVPLKEESDPGKETKVEARESKLLLELDRRMDAITGAAQELARPGVADVMKFVKKIARTKAYILSTPDNTGILHQPRAFRHAHFLTLLAEAFLDSLTLYPLNLDEDVETSISPTLDLMFLLSATMELKPKEK